MASQVDATRSPSSKISSVQPWQKTPPQERTQPVEARVLTPQVGQVIAMREETPRTRGDDLIRCQRKTRRLGGIKAHMRPSGPVISPKGLRRGNTIERQLLSSPASSPKGPRAPSASIAELSSRMARKS